MPTIPLIPTNSHPCPLDPNLRIVSTKINAGVVVTVLERDGAFLVTATYPGPPCQSWTIPGTISDPEQADQCARVLLGDPRRH